MTPSSRISAPFLRLWVSALLIGLYGTPAGSQDFEVALDNGFQSRDALTALNAFLDRFPDPAGQPALFADPDSPRQWSVLEAGSRLFPRLLQAAFLTDSQKLRGPLTRALLHERTFANRAMGLPDDVDLSTGAFVHPQVDPDRILSASAQYAAALASAVKTVGPGIYLDRLREVVDAIVAFSDSRRSHELPPSDQAQVNGHLLQALVWLAAWTEEEAYLDRARQIGDLYCLNVLPRNGGLPASKWDFTADRARDRTLVLDDSGYPILEGLILLYAAEMARSSDRTFIYRPTLSRMFDVLYANAVDEEGIFYGSIQPDGRGGYEVARRSQSSRWAAILALSAAFGHLSGNPSYFHPAVAVLTDLPGRLPQSAESKIPLRVADLLTLVTYAYDTGLLPLSLRTDLFIGLNRLARRLTSTGTWADIDGLIAFARQKTRGVRAKPWDPALQIGAVSRGDSLSLTLRSDRSWQGRVFLPMRMPGESSGLGAPHPFTPGTSYALDPNAYYSVRIEGAGSPSVWHGSLLNSGLRVALRPGSDYRIHVYRDPEVHLALERAESPRDSLAVPGPGSAP